MRGTRPRPVVLFAVAAIAVAAVTAGTATASFTQPFNVFILKSESSFFENREAAVRTAPGGAVAIRRVFVRNIGEGDAPPTRVGFRWERQRDGDSPPRLGPVIRSVPVGRINSGEQKRTGRARVPFPPRNGRYRLHVCANTPKIERPEFPRGNNCAEKRRLVIIDRQGAPVPGEQVLVYVSPTEGQFGFVGAGSESSQMFFTVRNDGTGSTGAGTSVIQGNQAYAFRIGTDGCDRGLDGTSACRVGVTYAPTDSAAHQATLVVSFTGGASVSVPLYGQSG